MENVITMTQLNDFLFCSRSLYFNGIFHNNVTGEFYHKYPQTLGLIAHSAIDQGCYSTRSDILTGTMVYCEKYNLLGRIDIFDISQGILTERKYAVSTIYEGFKLQLYAQFLALTEMGFSVQKLRLISKKNNKIYPVSLPTEKDFLYLETILQKMRKWTPFEIFLPPNPNKCKNCVYSSLCDYTTS